MINSTSNKQVKRVVNLQAKAKARREEGVYVAEGLRMCSEVYHTLKTLLKTRGYSTAVGDEGGFAPDFKNAEEALTCLMDAVSVSGYEPGKDFCFAIDAAASELYDSRTGRYVFPGESRMSQRNVSRSSEEMVEYLR